MITLPFEELVRREMNEARLTHAPINSAHEGYAVLLEEVEEFWDEVKKKRKDRDVNRMLEELVQIGAMAQRCAEDVIFPALTTAVEEESQEECHCGWCESGTIFTFDKSKQKLPPPPTQPSILGDADDAHTRNCRGTQHK